MGMTAIESVGVHVPRYRIAAQTVADAWGQYEPSGIESVAVPGPDEDSLTMAVEAAERAIGTSTVAREDISALTLGTTTPPMDESDLAAQAVAMLGLEADVESGVFTQSTRAGTQALRTAAEIRDGAALTIAADAPEGAPDDALGQGAGAGAVAAVLTDEGPVTITDGATSNRAYPGTRYRERGGTDVQAYGATSYERQAYAETVAEAIEGLEARPQAVAPTAPDGALPYRATNALDGDPSVYQRARTVGDTGAASAFFSLLAAWDEDESDVALVGYGDGASADALHLSGSTIPVDSSIPVEDVGYPKYLRLRGEIVTTGGDR